MTQDIQDSINKLSKKDWLEIQAIYDEIVNHKGPFSVANSVKSLKDGVISMPYYNNAPIVFRTMKFLFDKKLIVVFDWGNWNEGREIYKRTGEHKFDDVSLIDTFKLLTAVARNDRFNEGAFAILFETGDARLLFKRILTFRPKRVKMIDQIIDKLASRQTNNISVNNFYCGNDKETQNRLNNIAKYLEYYENNPPKYIFIGEAPGYIGCAQSGIPFTSLDIISSLDFFKNKVQLLGGKEKERTSTMIWDLIGPVAEPPMLWNAFPFHPHKNNLPNSNRKPKVKEIEEGLEYIIMLQKVFPDAKLIAVGNVAYESLTNFGISVYDKVRHPSFGGKAQFDEKMAKILAT